MNRRTLGCPSFELSQTFVPVVTPQLWGTQAHAARMINISRPVLVGMYLDKDADELRHALNNEEHKEHHQQELVEPDDRGRQQ